MPTAILDSPFTQNEHTALATAKQSAKRIHAAAKVAAFNGWTLAAAAVVSAPFALGSTTGVLVTLGLAIASFNEFHGRRRLLGFDPAAARFLGWSQLYLLGLIVGYSAWMLHENLTGASSFAAQIKAQPEIEQALGSLDGLEGLYETVVIAVYGGVIAASIVFQGLNALYYFSRAKYIAAYVAGTPEWALDVLRD